MHPESVYLVQKQFKLSNKTISYVETMLNLFLTLYEGSMVTLYNKVYLLNISSCIN